MVEGQIDPGPGYESARRVPVADEPEVFAQQWRERWTGLGSGGGVNGVESDVESEPFGVWFFFFLKRQKVFECDGAEKCL